MNNIRTMVSIILGGLCIDAMDKLDEAEKIALIELEKIDKDCRPLAEKVLNEELLKAFESLKHFGDIDMWMLIFTPEDVEYLLEKILKGEKISMEEVNKRLERNDK